MKAMVYNEYGAPSVLKLQEVDKPVPKINEMLIKMHAATVSSGDARLRALNVTYGFNFLTKLAMGFGKPRNGILGVELAGEVEAIGKDVTLFKVGDKVFGANGSTGACAQYTTIAEDGAVATLPDGMSFEQAVGVPFGALSSLIFLRDMGKVQSGQKVLINGASGGLGTFAVQLAKHFGCEVTGVCSGGYAELVKLLGADKVIDYAKEDFCLGDQHYDVVYDTIGNINFNRCKNVLTENGRCVLAVAPLPSIFRMLRTALFSSGH
jgi:NADPH:quinone reductase-like Zn-dependent oxidoreductase